MEDTFAHTVCQSAGFFYRTACSLTPKRAMTYRYVMAALRVCEVGSQLTPAASGREQSPFIHVDAASNTLTAST